jgi:hypothetical protein
VVVVVPVGNVDVDDDVVEPATVVVVVVPVGVVVVVVVELTVVVLDVELVVVVVSLGGTVSTTRQPPWRMAAPAGQFSSGR